MTEKNKVLELRLFDRNRVYFQAVVSEEMVIGLTCVARWGSAGNIFLPWNLN